MEDSWFSIDKKRYQIRMHGSHLTLSINALPTVFFWHYKYFGNRMHTPWGLLKNIDLSSHEQGFEILSADKHQLLEGLVVECLFDQIVTYVAPANGKEIRALDVESIVVDTGRKQDRWLVFVWARNTGEGLGRYLMALEKCFTPYLVNYSDGEFTAARVRDRRLTEKPRPLPDVMRELSRGKETPFRVDGSVKNTDRQRQAFWGFISNYYKSGLGMRVVLPRILINCGIQPYFRSVWNLDRIFLVDGDVWLFEIKHKFPMDWKGLHFGINDGEIKVLSMLVDAGIRCLHTILVKPQWSKEVGSMYLLNDLSMRARAAVIAAVLDEGAITRMMARISGQSGVHTSINGKSRLSFKNIAATDFVDLGVLADQTTNLANRISEFMTGSEAASVSDDRLRSLRTQKAFHQ